MKYSTVTGIDEHGRVLSVGRNGFIKVETAKKIAEREKMENAVLRHAVTDIHGNLQIKQDIKL